MVGICNGFQILREAGLLPGALQKNAGLKFRCETVELRVETTTTVLTNKAQIGADPAYADQPLRGELRRATRAPSKALQDNDQIVLRYVDNPNGSLDDIAGICNDGRNVVGLMPHPERACEPDPRARPTAPSCCGPCC